MINRLLLIIQFHTVLNPNYSLTVLYRFQEIKDKKLCVQRQSLQFYYTFYEKEKVGWTPNSDKKKAFHDINTAFVI